jgi:hypothetical protein
MISTISIDSRRSEHYPRTGKKRKAMQMQRKNVVTLAGLLVIASCLDRKTGNRTDGAVLGDGDVVPAIPGTGGGLGADADRIPDVRYSDVPPSHDVPIWGHETGGGVGGTGGGVAFGGNTGGGMSGVDSALLGTGGTVATGGGPVPSGGLLGGGAASLDPGVVLRETVAVPAAVLVAS